MNKSHPKSRFYVGKLLDSQERHIARVLQKAPPDKPKRDYRMTVAAVCIGVSVAGLIVSAILAVVWP